MSSHKASLVKKIGHSEESKFNLIFGDSPLEELNLSGASEDCFVENIEYKNSIKEKLNFGKHVFSVSLKSGKTWQFSLGRIDEISSLEFIKANISQKINEKGKTITIVKHEKSFENIKQELKSVNFWNKYLKKGNLLCYNDKKGNYTFFDMDELIKCITKNFQWRLLETGRIKGDCVISNKIKKGVITIEFRNESHKQCLVLGAHGGTGDTANGYRLFLFLKENINSIRITPLQ